MNLLTVENLALMALGFLLGEVLDVCYDGMVYYESETNAVRIFEPTLLHFGQIKYKIQFRLPTSFEHYQWGIWFLALSLLASAMPGLLQDIALVAIGTGFSLILDENRTGIGGHPFGIGKEFTCLSFALGIILVGLLVSLFAGLLQRTDPLTEMIVILFPFLLMPLFHLLESRGVLRTPWP